MKVFLSFRVLIVVLAGLLIASCVRRETVNLQALEKEVSVLMGTNKLSIVDEKHLNIKCHTYLDSLDIDNERSCSLVAMLVGRHYRPDVIELPKRLNVELIDTLDASNVYKYSVSIPQAYLMQQVADSSLHYATSLYSETQFSNELLNAFVGSNPYNYLLSDSSYKYINVNGIRKINIGKAKEKESGYRVKVNIKGGIHANVYFLYDAQLNLFDIEVWTAT